MRELLFNLILDALSRILKEFPGHFEIDVETDCSSITVINYGSTAEATLSFDKSGNLTDFEVSSLVYSE